MSRFVATSMVKVGLLSLPIRPGLQSLFSSSSGDLPHQPLEDLRSCNRTVSIIKIELEHHSARHHEPELLRYHCRTGNIRMD